MKYALMAVLTNRKIGDRQLQYRALHCMFAVIAIMPYGDLCAAPIADPAPLIATDTHSWVKNLVVGCGGQYSDIPGNGVHLVLPSTKSFELLIDGHSSLDSIKGILWRPGKLSAAHANRLVRRIPALEVLVLDGVTVEREAISAIAKLTRLRLLSMSAWRSGWSRHNARLDDDAVACLSGSKTIAYLDVTGHFVTGETLKGLHSLKELYLSSLSAKGCSVLGDLEHIEKLNVIIDSVAREHAANLGSIAIDTNVLRSLGRLKNLKSLRIQGSVPDPSDFAHVSLLPIAMGCHQLEDLSCPGDWINTRTASELAQLPDLKTIRLYGEVVGHEVFEQLASSRSLRDLRCDAIEGLCEHLRRNGQPGNSAKESSFSDLTHLSIDTIPIQDSQIKVIAKLQSLESLAIRVDESSSDGLTALGVLPRLRELKLSRIGGGPDYPWNNGPKAEQRAGRVQEQLGLADLRSLEVLTIVESNLNFTLLDSLDDLGKLACINFHHTNIGQRTLESLELLGQVKHLGIDKQCYLPDGDPFGHIARMTALRYLDLHDRYTTFAFSASKSLQVVRCSRESQYIDGILYISGGRRGNELGPGANAF